MTRSLLVTGGTGYFGRAFIGRILEEGQFERICVYSRGEYAQAEMRRQFLDDPRLRWFIGDVRDRDRLKRALRGVDTVVHAAALKRVEVGYYNPIEMVRTNVVGAENVIEASLDTSVKRAVLVSTDKAVEPINIYGKTKAVAEDLFLNADSLAGKGGPRFALARYGNVWGSTGSVAPTWASIIERGSSVVPVTDPECTRFFMHIRDATALILNLIQNMKGGEISIPELPAYRLGDLAEAMGVEVRVTGLPSWEKRHESMRPGFDSSQARRMSLDELRAALEESGYQCAYHQY